MKSIFESATNTVTVDLKTKNRLKMIDAVQGESDTRKIAFTIVSGGEAVTIPPEATVKIAFKTAAGTGGYYSKLHDDSSAYSIDGNVVTITVVQEALSAAGVTMLVVILENANGNRIATFPVEISVSPNPEQEALEPANYYEIESIIDDYLDHTDVVARREISPSLVVFTQSSMLEETHDVVKTNINDVVFTFLRYYFDGGAPKFEVVRDVEFKRKLLCATPTTTSEAANKGYVDGAISSIPTKTVTVTYTDGTTDSFDMLVGGANS